MRYDPRVVAWVAVAITVAFWFFAAWWFLQ